MPHTYITTEQLTENCAQAIEEQGFAVIRKLVDAATFSPEFIEYLNATPKIFDGTIGAFDSPVIDTISSKLQEYLIPIASTLGLAVSTQHFGVCAIRIKKDMAPPRLQRPFSLHKDPKIAPGGALNWHLDHYSYFIHKDHTNWLICYLPVLKPERSISNVSIIPTNVLRERDPYTHEAIKGRGAMRFRKVEVDTLEWFEHRFQSHPGPRIGSWWAVDDYDDSSMGWELRLDLEECKQTPQLDVGDLLIMRADVIHRTEDSLSDRIAIRCDAIPPHAALPAAEIAKRLQSEINEMGTKRRYSVLRWLSANAQLMI